MLTPPEHLMILMVFVGFTLLVLFLSRSCSILFICFVLVISCNLYIAMFLIYDFFLSLYLYDFLDYPCGLLLRYIRLPIFYIYIYYL